MNHTIDIALFIAQLAVACALVFFSYLNLLYAVCRDVPLPNVEFYSETTK